MLSASDYFQPGSISHHAAQRLVDEAPCDLTRVCLELVSRVQDLLDGDAETAGVLYEIAPLRLPIAIDQKTIDGAVSPLRLVLSRTAANRGLLLSSLLRDSSTSILEASTPEMRRTAFSREAMMRITDTYSWKAPYAAISAASLADEASMAMATYMPSARTAIWNPSLRRVIHLEKMVERLRESATHRLPITKGLQITLDADEAERVYDRLLAGDTSQSGVEFVVGSKNFPTSRLAGILDGGPTPAPRTPVLLEVMKHTNSPIELVEREWAKWFDRKPSLLDGMVADVLAEAAGHPELSLHTRTRLLDRGVRWTPRWRQASLMRNDDLLDQIAADSFIEVAATANAKEMDLFVKLANAGRLDSRHYEAAAGGSLIARVALASTSTPIALEVPAVQRVHATARALLRSDRELHIAPDATTWSELPNGEDIPVALTTSVAANTSFDLPDDVHVEVVRAPGDLREVHEPGWAYHLTDGRTLAVVTHGDQGFLVAFDAEDGRFNTYDFVPLGVYEGDEEPAWLSTALFLVEGTWSQEKGNNLATTSSLAN